MHALIRLIAAIPLFGDIARYVYQQIDRKHRPTYWIAQYVNIPDAHIVQIGSNDGQHDDPLCRLVKRNSAWQCLFVEPVPYLFARLRRNYGNAARFKFANVAVNEGRVAEFYWVDPAAKQHVPNLGSWYDGLGSFNKSHILKHVTGALEPYIVTTEIAGTTLPALLAQQDINRIDVLHIDTEGYDWKILSQLDLNRFQPVVILYEHRHLSARELQASADFLKEHYALYRLRDDIIAFNKTADGKQLAAAEKALRKRRVV